MEDPLKLTIDRKSLLEMTTRAAKVADQKSAMPALGCTLLSAGHGRTRADATDLYLAVSSEAECEVAEDGAVHVNAAALADRVRAMPDGPVTLAGDKNKLTLKSGSRRFELACFDPNDAPPMPKPKRDGVSFSIAGEALSTLIARTKFSISTDETRAHVNSALLESDGKILRMVSTDGHRLTLSTCVTGTSAFSLLIPRRAVERLEAMIEDGNVMVHLDGPWVHFDVSVATRFSTKLVDAQFPPYRQVIPKDTGRDVEVSRTGLLSAVQAVSVAATKHTGGVKLVFEADTLRVFAESPEAGNGTDELVIEYDGPKATIGINAKYLAEVLGAVDVDNVTLGIGGELDPVLVKPVGDESMLAVVMPMRT